MLLRALLDGTLASERAGCMSDGWRDWWGSSGAPMPAAAADAVVSLPPVIEKTGEVAELAAAESDGDDEKEEREDRSWLYSRRAREHSQPQLRWQTQNGSLLASESSPPSPAREAEAEEDDESRRGVRSLKRRVGCGCCSRCCCC